MGERARRAIENTVGALLGFGLCAALMGLGMKAFEAIGLDPTMFFILFVIMGGGHAYDGVRACMTAVRVANLYVRARRYVRAGRWEELALVARELVEHHEWHFGFDLPRTVALRHGLIFVLVQLERFEEAAGTADQNARSLSRRLGDTHPDTEQAHDLAQALREAARDPEVAEELRRAMRPADRLRP